MDGISIEKNEHVHHRYIGPVSTPKTKHNTLHPVPRTSQVFLFFKQDKMLNPQTFISLHITVLFRNWKLSLTIIRASHGASVLVGTCYSECLNFILRMQLTGFFYPGAFI